MDRPFPHTPNQVNLWRTPQADVTIRSRGLGLLAFFLLFFVPSAAVLLAILLLLLP